jgi:cation transport regulator
VPYVSNVDLPARVRSHLPPHAQDIFREAFNDAWRTYTGSRRREEIANRVAWSAVKKRYRKVGDAWVPDRAKPSSDDARSISTSK